MRKFGFFLVQGVWSQLFSIVEETYHAATLEVLSTIKMHHRMANFDKAGSIRF